MRLWLKDSERRTDPTPRQTDDRKAVVTGLALWLAALVVVLIVVVPQGSGDNLWAIWTCVAGIGLGLIGLLYTHLRNK